MSQVRFFALDVEADGPCPGLYSMVSFAVVPVDEPDRAFYSEIRPIGTRFQPEALAVAGFTREQTLDFAPTDEVMARFRDWAQTEIGAGRGVLVSDNPGFDAGFLTHACEWAGFANPFGHSARRLGDVWAGMSRDLRDTRGWKRLTSQRHTHHALDDARKVAQGWQQIQANLRRKPTPV